MTKIFGALVGILIFLVIPILLIFLLMRKLKKKSVKKVVIAIITGVGLSVVFTIAGVLTNPATWCEHQYNVIEEVAPTCTKRGKIVKKCSLCETKITNHIKKVAHSWEIDSVVNVTCTSGGYTIEKCNMCTKTQKTNETKALGHSIKVVSRIEPTTTSEGEIVSKCERCDYTEREVLEKLKDTPSQSDDKYITGDEVGGEIVDVPIDTMIDKLCSFGFTETEAYEIREIFLKCGLTNIDNAEPTNANATIDGLITYRVIIDDKRTAWFTIDNRKVYYIGLNGTDVYDSNKGGFLINIDDVHIPESEITYEVKDELTLKTRLLLEPYFVKALRFSEFAFGRSDNNYVVRCKVYAENRMGFKDTVMAFVYYEYDGTKFNVTAISIDGVRYK